MKEIRYIIISNEKFEILISDEEEALLEAKLDKRASIAILKNKNLDISLSKYAVLEYEDIDEIYLEKVVYRYYDLGFTIIENEELRIREFCKKDYDRVSELEREGYLGEDDKIFHNKDSFYAYVSTQYDFYEYGIFAIERLKDKEILGKIGLNILKDKIYVSYHIDKKYRAKGYGYKALKLLLEYIRKEYPDNIIYAKIDSKNKNSLKLAKKLNINIETFV